MVKDFLLKLKAELTPARVVAILAVVIAARIALKFIKSRQTAATPAKGA